MGLWDDFIVSKNEMDFGHVAIMFVTMLIFLRVQIMKAMSHS